MFLAKTTMETWLIWRMMEEERRMKMQIVLVGVGEDSVDIVEDAIREWRGNAVIEGVAFDEDELYFKLSDQSYPARRIEDLPSMPFDRLYVCANSFLAEEAVELFREKLGLSKTQCSSYVKSNIGPRTIDWDRAETEEDVIEQIIQSGTMNDLEKFAYCDSHRLLFKWLHYYEVYDRHFSKYRNTAPVIMEIGVSKGGSLQMWKKYFGEGVRIIGIDVDERTREFAEEQISIEIGSQEDREFLREMKEKYPRIDILIDDGGHTMNQQIVTFEEMFPHIAYGGTYLCEDLHTSYWKKYGGGYRHPDSYIEYSKNFIDYIHAWHSEVAELQENRYSRSMHSLHYYNSILVIEKERMGNPIAARVDR